MNHPNKGKAKNILAWALPLLFILLTYHFEGFAKLIRTGNRNIYVQVVSDTPPPVLKPDTLIRKTRKAPSISEEKKIADTTLIAYSDTFAFKRSKDSLTSPVVYHADDSMVIDVPGKKMYLYGKISSVNYDENNLSAPLIEFDQKTNIVKAVLTKDSTGKVTSYPYYSQGKGGFESVSDTIEFNMKSGRGLTKGTYTKQGELFVYGEKIKKADTSTFYAYRARFTTCNLDTPHFAFIAKKVKFVNKKWAYTGPVHPEFEGVPLPIMLPFGIFPLSQGRHSGLLQPSFTTSPQLGTSLENFGYYKIISPNWDLITQGSIWSYGSWFVRANPRYYRRYHYQGNIDLQIRKTKILDQKGDRGFRIDWSHSSDQKARPGVNFTASVHGGSTKYNSLVQNNIQVNYQNQLNSTISYSKVWKNRPYQISINAAHDQNAQTGLINLNLPVITFSVNTLYPFRRSDAAGSLKWYENIGVGYNVNTRSQTSFYDTAGHITRQIKDNLEYGALHNVPITLSLPPIGPLQIAPSVSYSETWLQNRLTQKYNPATKTIDSTLQKGLYTSRQMSFGVSLTTRIFGMYQFREKSRVKAIRHEIRPTVSINYQPNFNARSYYTAVTDTTGILRELSYFSDNRIYSAYSNRKFGGLDFSIDNNVTMKVRDKNDTSAKADKKVSLIDGFTISGRYNFLDSTFKLSDLVVAARSNLTDKVNITAGAVFSPYQVNSSGERIDKYVWSKNPFTLGRLMQGNVALSSHLQGGDKKNKDNSNAAMNNLIANNTTGLPLDEYQSEAAYIQNNPGEFVDFEIPWQVDGSYSLYFVRSFNLATKSFKTDYTQSINLNTSANLTPKWKIGANTSYDITAHKLQTITMFLSRDLHCWQMSINVSRSDRYRFFSIFISPKSPILRDLKVNRTRSSYDL